MFTGLIQDVGRVVSLRAGGEAADLVIETPLAAALRLGDSLAVNGVCLTAAALAPPRVTLTAIPETLARTNLGGLRAGAPVNLEPALRAGDPLGGHIVQGHVDATGRLARREPRDRSVELTFEAPAEVMRYVVVKGSIAIEGVSLTVAGVAPGRDRFHVALVPHTLEHTTLGRLAPGAPVNLEADVIAKYVEGLLPGARGDDAGQRLLAKLGAGRAPDGREGA